ncbi:MAG: hypothetical protein R3D55_03605 [Chloroflexota bacterium]
MKAPWAVQVFTQGLQQIAEINEVFWNQKFVGFFNSLLSPKRVAQIRPSESPVGELRHTLLNANGAGKVSSSDLSCSKILFFSTYLKS